MEVILKVERRGVRRALIAWLELFARDDIVAEETVYLIDIDAFVELKRIWRGATADPNM